MIRREQTAMELTQLRYFKALAAKGNLTKTAEALHLSAPALSVSIKRLEEELNTKLFDRRKGSALFLNDKGQIFLAEVSKALDCLDAAIKNIQETNHAKNSRLNLATSSPMLYQDLLVAFRLAHPDIYVSHAYLNLYQLAQKSQLSRFDCIIAAPGDIPQELLGDLCSCTLYRNDRPLVMVYPTHRFAARQSISLSELKGEAFIALEKTASSRKMFDSIFEEAGFLPNIAFECDYGMRSRLIAETHGLGISTLFVKLSTSKSPEIFVELNDCTYKRKQKLFWSRRAKNNASLSIFRKFAVAYYQKFDVDNTPIASYYYDNTSIG